MNRSFIFTAACENRTGILAGVSSMLFAEGADITAASQFDDTVTNKFFIRIVFNLENDVYASGHLENAIASVASEFNLSWKLRPEDKKKKVLILVSLLDHCLADLLYRYQIGELPMEVVGIVSNHPQDKLNVNLDDSIPYYHLPVSAETKAQQETKIKQIIEENDVDLVVLARYMQILSNDLAGFLAGRCINIHHSSLPSFKGAKPYHQAYDRGVKLIGATAHFVTADLDEGPIIEQDVEHISHIDTPQDLVRKGRDIERRVLARAVSYVLEDRVLLNENKTVVFHD